AETNKEFYEWAIEGNIPTNERIYRGDKLMEFTRVYPDYGRNRRYELSQKSFKIYIDKYASFLGLECKDDQDMNGRYSEILDPENKHSKENKQEDDQIPF